MPNASRSHRPSHLRRLIAGAPVLGGGGLGLGSITHAAFAADAGCADGPFARAARGTEWIPVFPDGGFSAAPAAENTSAATTSKGGPGGLYATVPPLARTTPNPGSECDPSPTTPLPGLMRTDPQGGLGATLYQPIPVPTPAEIPTELERDKFLTRGLFPGTYLIPGTNTSFKWYGFVRVDGIFDLNPIASTDSFVTAAIPIPQGRGQNFDFNARYSRLGLDTWTPTPWFDWDVHTRIEVDFFNGNTSGVFGSVPLPYDTPTRTSDRSA